MLERATACLKAGARDSLRCTKHTSCSQRMLHSTFWTHGAGDLDLPPGLLDIHPPPTDIQLKHDSPPFKRTQRVSARSAGVSPPDGLFLDFLYPPPALALLQRAHIQHWERWERRNARRLPDGFIQASRGYSSRSYARAANVPAQVEEEHGIVPEAGFVPLTEENQNPDEEAGEGGFGDLPGDLAEADRPQPDSAHPGTDALHQLRRLLSGERGRSVDDAVKQAWSLYHMLDEDDKGNSLLKKELLLWLNAKKTELASAHCISLYWSFPLDRRTLEIYEVALASFLRRSDFDFATGLHEEALNNISNGSQVTKTLFRHALEQGQWLLALRTYVDHDKHFSSPGQAHHRATFWFHVAEIDGLTTIASRLITKIHSWRAGEAHVESLPLMVDMTTKMTEEAILQFARTRTRVPQGRYRRTVPTKEHHKNLSSLVDFLLSQSPKAQDILATAIPSILQEYADLNSYAYAHPIVSHMYTNYCKSPRAKPSEELLMTFLERLKLYWDITYRREEIGLHLKDIFNDWVRYHGRSSLAGIELLASFHARHGQRRSVDHYVEYAKRMHPEYEDHKKILWASVYVHARRADLPEALHAFEQINDLARTHHGHPSLASWGALFYAYYKGDDLDGALTMFRKFLETGLKPQMHTVHPIITMMAKRGDVEGVEHMIQQYTDISNKDPHPRLIGSRLTALVRAGQVEDAEKALHNEVERAMDNEEPEPESISGPRSRLTGCCNILLTAYAFRPDIGGTMRLYRMMKARSIAMNAETYSALMQALVQYNQTNAAKRILTHIMPREGLRPTSFHYALLIDGHVREGSYPQAITLYKEMRRHGHRPSAATTRAYSKATTLFEHDRSDGRRERQTAAFQVIKRGRSANLSQVEEIRKSIREHKPSSITEKGPRHGADSTALVNGINEYVDYAMFLHGRANNLDTVEQLFAMYRDEVARRGLSAGPPPMRMLTALMNAHFHARKFDMVESYWKVAKDEADRFAPTPLVPDFRQYAMAEPTDDSPALVVPQATVRSEPNEAAAAEIGFSPTTPEKSRRVQDLLPKTSQNAHGPRPAPGRALALTKPLRYYLRTLLYQNRINDMIKVVTQLLRQGYRLDSIAWNRFVEYLCQAPVPPLLLAFILTERYLMPGFPGWVRATRNLPTRNRRVLGIQYMRVGFEGRRKLLPHYRTMLYLAKGLADLKKAEAYAGERRDGATSGLGQLRGSVRQILERAPRTVAALEAMPVAEEKWQARILRGQG